MTKNHELIAALSDRASAAEANIAETSSVFSHKATDLFFGYSKVTQAVDEGRRGEFDGTEEKPCTTTVYNRFDYTFDLIAKELDLQLQIDRTNGKAKADVIIDGKVIAKDVPVTTLLSCEKHVRKWMAMTEKAPTLATGVSWKPDPSLGANFFVTSKPRETSRTEKVPWSLVLLAPTKEHPGQAVEKARETVVSKTHETQYSGMIESVKKAQMQSRLQELAIAFQAARQRANEAVAEPGEIGATLKAYVLDGKFPVAV